ncbi:MAG: response regulator [Clostridia bacterium]|nr:response regulator [Clostridia bacterium]
MRIIIVDDEVNALHIFLDEIMLQGGVEYKFFKDDAESILAYISDKRVDAAFLDIKMPNIDGIELAEKIIKICPDIKIVFITGLNINEKGLPESIRANTLGFIYKPYDKNELINYLNAIANVTLSMRVTMFETFECFLNDVPLEFSSAKSKELFALLLVYRGKTLTMADAISHLWPDHDKAKAKILYRDAVWRLRKTLQKADFNCIAFSRGELSLNNDNITCDFWEVLDKKTGCYHGDFLKNYDWSVEYLTLLDS